MPIKNDRKNRAYALGLSDDDVRKFGNLSKNVTWESAIADATERGVEPSPEARTPTAAVFGPQSAQLQRTGSAYYSPEEEYLEDQENLKRAASEMREERSQWDEVDTGGNPAQTAVGNMVLAQADVAAASPELSRHSEAVLQHQMAHIATTSDDATAKSTANEYLAGESISPLIGPHLETLENLDVSDRQSREKTGTPAKTQTYSRTVSSPREISFSGATSDEDDLEPIRPSTALAQLQARRGVLTDSSDEDDTPKVQKTSSRAPDSGRKQRQQEAREKLLGKLQLQGMPSRSKTPPSVGTPVESRPTIAVDKTPAPSEQPPPGSVKVEPNALGQFPEDTDIGNGWTQTQDNIGRVYYFNEQGESIWDDPRQQTPAPDPESIDSPAVTSAAVHPHSHVSSVVPLEHILSEQEKMNVASTEKITLAIKSQSQAFSSSGETTAALNNLENNPRTAKLFERGLLRPQNVANKQYVIAMEKSLKDREDRLGTLPKMSSRLAKQTPVEYTRTIARPGGVYKYRRPHFTTSPLFS